MQRSAGPRMNAVTHAVLQVLLDDPTRERHGLEIGQAAGLASGTFHPTLARLERCGWVESRWENLDADDEDGLRRRWYRLTPDGVVGAAQTLNRAGTRPTGALTPRLQPGLADGHA